MLQSLSGSHHNTNTPSWLRKEDFHFWTSRAPSMAVGQLRLCWNLAAGEAVIEVAGQHEADLFHLVVLFLL